MTRSNDRKPQDIAVAYLLLRMTIGLNIFIHGLSRLFMGVTVFAGSLVPMFAKTFLPGWSVYTFGYVPPIVETLVGASVLFGFQTRRALISGSVLMLVLTFGSTLRQDWPTVGIQLTYSLVYSFLLAGIRFDSYGIDQMLRSSTQGET